MPSKDDWNRLPDSNDDDRPNKTFGNVSDNEFARIRTWVCGTEKPPAALLSRWLSHPDFMVSTYVAQNARWVDKDLAHSIYRAYRENHLLDTLIQNRFLSSEVVSSIAVWLVDDWEACVRDQSPIVGAPWVSLAFLLRAQKEKVPSEVIRRVYTFPALSHDQTFSSDEHLWAAKGAINYFSFTIINERLPVSSEVLRVMVSHCPGDASTLRALMQHPNADASVLRAAFEISPAVWNLVAAHPETRWDAEIRPWLLGSSRPDVLIPLVEDADPKTAAKLVRYLISNDALVAAAEALRLRTPTRPIDLGIADFMPLLNAPHREVRLVALTYVGLRGVEGPKPGKTFSIGS